MNEEIKLRRVEDPQPEKNTLPRGVHAVVLNEEVFFVRKVGKNFLQLPLEEQERLRKKHIV